MKFLENFNFHRIFTLFAGVVIVHQTPNAVAQNEVELPFRTTNGSVCITNCDKYGYDYNWCYIRENPVGWTDKFGGWGHCSPNPGVTYKGQACETRCEKYQGYYWCYLDEAHRNWDYCGPSAATPNFPVITQRKTINGEECISACDYVGETYGWCYKAGGSWNYCSPKSGHDINGARCSNTCDYRGESYSWCYLESGGWGRCGQQSSIFNPLYIPVPIILAPAT